MTKLNLTVKKVKINLILANKLFKACIKKAKTRMQNQFLIKIKIFQTNKAIRYQ